MTSLGGLCVSVLHNSYVVAFTSVSSTDGSHLQSLTKSIPTSLDTPISQSLLPTLSHFAQLRPIKSCTLSFPPSFSRAQINDVVSAASDAGLNVEESTLDHRQAYCALLPLDTFPPFIIFLEVTHSQSTAQLVECQVKNEERRTRLENYRSRTYNTSTSPVEAATSGAALVDLLMNPDVERIVLLDPLPEIAQALQSALSAKHPSIPVHTASLEDLSRGAAASAFTYMDHGPWPVKILAQYVMPLPLSIATADGGVAVVLTHLHRLTATQSVLFTTAQDSQSSVTVQILLGSHPKPSDNLTRATVVLDGLAAKPKGTNRIRVSLRVTNGDDSQVEIEELRDGPQPGPRKVVQLPDVVKNLPEGYSRYIFPNQPLSDLAQDQFVGELPL
jgi:Hsp70 protein